MKKNAGSKVIQIGKFATTDDKSVDIKVGDELSYTRVKLATKVKEEVELDESEFDAMAYGKKDQRFVVKPRDTKGMRGKQDQFKMYVVKIDNRGNEIKVIKDLGSHSSIAGAKKFAVNRGIIKEKTILERIDRKLKERKNG